MKVGVFYPSNNKEHLNVLTAFATGIQRQGVDVEMIPLEKYAPVDVAVVFGVKKKNMPISYARGHVIDEQNKHQLPVIVLEKGYVHRDKYYSAGFGGLNGRAFFRNKKSPADRWLDLKTELVPYKENKDGHYIVCGQVPTDASVQHVDINEWTAKTCNYIKTNFTDNVIFRPHPLALDRTPLIDGIRTSTRPLSADLENCKAVITFNSNAGVDATIAGVPIFAEDRGSMVYEFSIGKLELMRYPIISDRTEWAFNLAYTQWNIKEMSNGLPWQHLMREA